MFRLFVASAMVCGLAGVTPIMQGQDGYDEHLDRDGDGVACES